MNSYRGTTQTTRPDRTLTLAKQVWGLQTLATCCDRCPETYLATIALAATVLIWL